MKIKINEFESYEINLPPENEINIQRFNELLYRLNQINKMVNKDPINVLSNDSPVMNSKTEKKKEYKHEYIKKNYQLIKIERQKGRAFLRTLTREQFLDLLKVYYFGSSDRVLQFEKKIKQKFSIISPTFCQIRSKHNIQAVDLGLIRFPVSATEKKNISTLLIKKNGTKTNKKEKVSLYN